ncbi:hypothetical protein [Cellulomonas sp. URHE0023]|uniref:hypothetical protein n=1 Tax=Cellulomonas sp. URHE0023 TaxID=1380354 RepID=UPI00054ECFD7|nr:hypothetical protein [Cellulomonas sp. URHE0023]
MKVARLLIEMAASEAGLAAALTRLADDHAAEQDVHHVARDLSHWSQDHAAALAEHADALLPDPPDTSAGDDEPGAALLSDLRSVYAAACGLATDWDVLGQAAKAHRDDELLDLVELCAPRNRRQVTWLRAQRKVSAAQILDE